MRTSAHVSVFTVANVITALRLLVAPVFFFLLVQEEFVWKVWALVIFVSAALTDFVDGVLARSFGEISEVGKFLDPLADKVLVLSALFGFVWLELVPLWMVAIVAVRDAIATALRVWSLSEQRPLETSRLAKWKTFAQMSFVAAVLLVITLASAPWAAVAHSAQIVVDSGAITLAMAVVTALTVASLWSYVQRG